jgi:hypothetical protein
MQDDRRSQTGSAAGAERKSVGVNCQIILIVTSIAHLIGSSPILTIVRETLIIVIVTLIKTIEIKTIEIAILIIIAITITKTITIRVIIIINSNTN